MNQTETFKLAITDLALASDRLQSIGFFPNPTRSPYEKSRLVREKPSSATAIIYTSGKIVLQGKDLAGVGTVLSDLSESKQSSAVPDFSGKPRIGADEVGKGDYFGPLVTAACFITPQLEKQIAQFGITDSKKIDDYNLLDIFARLHPLLEYEVNIISPAKYNETYSQIRNASILLAKSHSESIEKLVIRVNDSKLKPEMIIVDQFSSRKDRVTNELGKHSSKLKIEQFHKGESDLAVACASIIARAYFLREWNDMEKQYDMEFPKGATNVISTGKKFVEINGADRLVEVAKLSFKTTKQVLNS